MEKNSEKDNLQKILYDLNLEVSTNYVKLTLAVMRNNKLRFNPEVFKTVLALVMQVDGELLKEILNNSSHSQNTNNRNDEDETQLID